MALLSQSHMASILAAVKNYINSKFNHAEGRIDTLSDKVDEYACDEGSELVSK